jgi:glutamine synthetase
MSDLWRDVFSPEVATGKEGGAQALAEKSGFQNTCVAEYVWLDGKGQTRSKCKTLDKTPGNADECSIWTFNGAASDQAPANQSDVYLVPRKVFADPVRGAPHVLVICEAITSGMEPAKGNFRAECAEQMEKYKTCEPWFGIEQEYVICDDQGTPLKTSGTDRYCGRGAQHLPKFMREIMGDHYAQCLSAGIKITGMNCEGGEAQGEFQIGPCKGLNAGDHLIAARHTLHKCANKYRCAISFKGCEESGVCNGLHVNFSSKKMRADGGLMWIEKVAKQLGNAQKDGLAAYGEGNDKRLQGKGGAPGTNFRFAVADRGASIRIPRNVGIVAKGYLEDRRPSANADPYRVTAHMMREAGKILKPS